MKWGDDFALLVNHVSKGENCGHTEHIVQQRYIHQQMQEFRMSTMLASVLWIDVVPYEIQWRYHKILHPDVQVIDVGPRQKSIIHWIDQNECDENGHSAHGECEHAQIEIVEKWDRFCAEPAQHPEEYDWHAK